MGKIQNIRRKNDRKYKYLLFKRIKKTWFKIRKNVRIFGLVKNNYELKKVQEIVYDIFNGVTRYDFLKEKKGIEYVEYLKTTNKKYKILDDDKIKMGFNLLISV